MSQFINLTDDELVVLLKAGESGAFEAIYRKYAKELYKYARKNIP
ncbi:MAG: hypothetical protein WDN75_10135 [Bacteroidota bacterium]